MPRPARAAGGIPAAVSARLRVGASTRARASRAPAAVSPPHSPPDRAWIRGGASTVVAGCPPEMDAREVERLLMTLGSFPCRRPP